MNKAFIKVPLIGSEESGHYEEARKKGEVVHSGHFMISSVADQEEIEESDHDRDSPIHFEQNRMRQHGYDFSNVSKETRSTYQFGPLPTNKITIDGSLARLFQCMSLAYQGGKVVSPKWKNFKGMKLTVKDKIRLNNAIWRTWHIQYIMQKRKEQSFIQFATPMEIDYNWHAKPEAVVMEGKYWKMRIESVVAEYKKWRGFFMEKLKLSDYPGLMWVSENVNTSSSSRVNVFEKPKSSDDTQLDDFSDTLFSTLLQQPFEFPNAREIAMQMTNSDMIQPGLLQLQPAVDDFLDFDSIHELLNPPKKNAVSFSNMPSQTFAPTSSEIFETSNLTNMLEAGAVQQQSNVPNNQSIDFNGGFQIPRKDPQHQSRQQYALSSDPRFSVVNVGHASIYPANSLQQATPGPMPGGPLNNNPPILQNYGMEQTKTYPIGQDMLQQQMLPKPNPPVNAEFEMSSNATNARRSYSHLKTSQETQYFPPNQTCDVVIQQTSTNNAMTVNRPQMQAHHMQAGSLLRSGVENSSINNQAMNVAPIVIQPPQPLQKRVNEMNMPVSSSDGDQLKLLLSSKSNASSQIRNARQGVNANQRIPTQSAQQPPSWPTIEQSQKTFVNVMQGPSRNVTFDQTAPGCQMDTTSSLQSLIESVDMEQGSHEPVLSIPQDHDIAQTEAQQRSDSFSTEQRRRYNIKMEFSRMQKMLYGDSFQSHTKTSKAALMSKAAQQIQKLKMEKIKRDKEISSLKEDLEKLKLSISSSQRQLPATGAPVPRNRTEEAKNQFDTWARERTKQYWKFYIFGVVIRPWFDSYLSHVSSVAMTRFNQSIREWLDTWCSLPVLRRGVVQSLQVLSTTTCILNNPSQLKKQIEKGSFRNQR